MVSWKQVRLGDIVEAIYDGPHATPTKTAAGPVFLGISSLRNGRLDLSKVEHLSERDFREWTRRVSPRADDIVFSYETRLGEAALIPSGLRCCLGRRMGLLRPNRSRVIPRFLLYAYLSPEFQATLRSRTVHGSTVDRILLTELGDFTIRVPETLEGQEAIVGILGALDDKIELNRKVNQILEETAQALFRAWFLDFEGESDFVESELGLIPRGWGVGGLEDIAEFLNGVACQRFPAEDGEVLRVIKIREINNGFSEASDLVSKKRLPAKYVVEDGDILFSWSGSLEVKIWHDEAGALNQHIFKVTSITLPTWFVYFSLLEHLPGFRHIAAGKATTMGHIRRRHLREALVAVPPKVILEKADPVIGQLIERFLLNHRESRTLADLRDTLLPKLISGEIRVPEAQEAVQEAV